MRIRVAFLLLALVNASASAQSPEEKARIDWEAAKLALQQNKPAVALAKLDSVIAVLGPLPDLLYTAAEAAFQAGDMVRAQEYASRTYSAADAAFKQSEQYGKLIALSARMEVEGPTLAAKAQGYWVDERTGLMWTIEDNGYDVDWNRAAVYCQQLRTGGFADWRLPSIDELQRIYDPQVSASYKIVAPLELSACCPWSGTKSDASSAWFFSFDSGHRYSFHLGFSTSHRALCVRRSGA